MSKHLPCPRCGDLAGVPARLYADGNLHCRHCKAKVPLPELVELVDGWRAALLQLSNEAAIRLLKAPETADLSDREIARMAGLSHPMIRGLREKYGKRLPVRRYVSKHGTQAT